jgi:CRISPR-associated protein Csb1
MISLTADVVNSWADDPSGPVALHLKQELLPVEGDGAVIFPPTYADIGYNIDTLPDGTKVCTIDSVGSQANRLEPIFKSADDSDPENPLARLVPQIDIAYGNRKKISIFEAGHRLGDAIIRTSTSSEFDLPKAANTAFDDFQRGNATTIAKLAPTSLVFGAWDSRDTQAKLPRIIQSVIRAWNVTEIHRAAQYEPAVDYVSEGFMAEPKDDNEAKQRSGRGYRHAPAVWRDDARKERVLGGVVARGSIRRDVTLNFLALRRLRGENTTALRRYVLGLALIAAAEPIDGFLRTGCLLTLDPASDPKWELVHRTGKRDHVGLNPDFAKAYAQASAEAFGTGPDRLVSFEPTLAEEDLKKSDQKKNARDKTEIKVNG